MQAALKQRVTRLEMKGFDLSHRVPKIQGWPNLQVLQDKRACSDSVALRLTLQLQLSQVSLRSLEAYASILHSNLPQLLEQTGYEESLSPDRQKLWSKPRCIEILRNAQKYSFQEFFKNLVTLTHYAPPLTSLPTHLMEPLQSWASLQETF